MRRGPSARNSRTIRGSPGSAPLRWSTQAASGELERSRGCGCGGAGAAAGAEHDDDDEEAVVRGGWRPSRSPSPPNAKAEGPVDFEVLLWLAEITDEVLQGYHLALHGASSCSSAREITVKAALNDVAPPLTSEKAGGWDRPSTVFCVRDPAGARTDEEDRFHIVTCVHGNRVVHRGVIAPYLNSMCLLLVARRPLDLVHPPSKAGL